jgi:hexosaminidase
VLKPLQPVAQQLGALSANGLIWLEKLQKGKTLNAQERQQAQSQLDDAAKVQDEVVLAVVYPLEKLLAGVK